METVLSVIVVLIVLVLLMFVAKKRIPGGVQASFQDQYPGALNMDWSANKKYFEVVFFYNGKKHKARYSKDGAWVETNIVFFKENLPEELKADMAERFKDFKFNDISKVENSNKEMYYKMIIETGNHVNYLLKVNQKHEILEVRNLTVDKVIKYDME